MTGRFPQEGVTDLLVRCHRRCCICHRFCGVKIETDHMDPLGGDDIDNAIPVCFECHAEIHSYNDTHPRGRKFRPEELRRHKEQWLAICAKRPEILIKPSRHGGVGPVQALIDELEYNLAVSNPGQSGRITRFLDEQFRRATREGVLSLMHDELKGGIIAAYTEMGRANQLMDVAANSGMSGQYSQHVNTAQTAMLGAGGTISKAREILLRFLASEGQ